MLIFSILFYILLYHASIISAGNFVFIRIQSVQRGQQLQMPCELSGLSNTSIYILTKKRLSIMKRIKKITASLLALAITCAGINCIPAKAASTSKSFYLYDSSIPSSVQYVSATATVNFIPKTQYTATTTQYYTKTFYRWVGAMAGRKSFTLSPVTKFTYFNESPSVTINCPARDIIWFQSSHLVRADKWDGTGEVNANTNINL